MPGTEYLRPDKSHIDALYQLETACFPSPWDREEIEILLNSSISLFTLAAFRNSLPAGYISATFSEPHVLHVISLGVHPEFRRQGIAGDLLSCAIHWGRHLGAKKVVLEVRQGNSPAMEFYRRWGFEVSELLRDFYGKGKDGKYMEREISPVPGTLDAVLYLNSRLKIIPKVGVVLGSGLGWVTEPFGKGMSIPFESIPGMSGNAVKGHAQNILFSSDGGIAFIMGRRHHYQGYSGREITLLPSALACLGVDRWLLTSSSGAVDPDYRVGDAMVFSDHVNYSGCIPDSPLKPVGQSIYSSFLKDLAGETITDSRSGVFACVSGPAYETAAEVAMIRSNGCSAVSMSTAQEAMALRALGCSVAAVALITNSTDSGDSVCHEEVLSAQEILRSRQEDSLVKLVERLTQ